MILKLTQVEKLDMRDQIERTEGITTFQSTEISETIQNGSFEEGDFREWRTIGDTSIETGDLGIFPSDGTYQALLSTGYSDAGASVIDLDLEEFLDLAPGSLDGLVGGDAIEGSVIKQTFTAEAGDIVSFDWNFVTNEDTPSAEFNDTAFLAITGFTLELADTQANFVPGVDQFTEQTGTQTLTISFSEAGTYTIGFGVVDFGDDAVDSGLVVDNIQQFPPSEFENFSLTEGSSEPTNVEFNPMSGFGGTSLEPEPPRTGAVTFSPGEGGFV